MKHIGLVLSGGMGKGAYQIGALTALNEFLKPSDFEFISAAFVGVLNTYAYLTGNLQKAYDIWASVNLQGDRRFITSVLRSSFLQDIITDIITDAAIPGAFYVPLLDLQNKELDYYNFSEIPSENIDPYLRASIAMPFYNKGIKIDDKTLYDGAVVDNIPIYPVLKNELDYVICIYFDDYNYVFEDYSYDDKIIKLTFPDNKRISNSVRISHQSIMNMLEDGYRRTKAVLSDVFADGTDDLQGVYAGIERQNGEDYKKMVRITGDVIVTNMNKLAKKVVRSQKIMDGGAAYAQNARQKV